MGMVIFSKKRLFFLKMNQGSSGKPPLPPCRGKLIQFRRIFNWMDQKTSQTEWMLSFSYREIDNAY
jgi:hypothetical protein